ncbi:DUF192 domain-containing protein [Streptomyces sp. NPDC006415]|uniref:DUF192 domain-containing protein n=1 Tax=Streptomyces sp. NPDC006415 TaxID=3155351 RepID=UPI0033A9B8F1
MRTWRDGEGTLTVSTDAGGGDEGGGGDGALGSGNGAMSSADGTTGSGGGAREVPLRIAASYRARTKGLLGRDGIEGAMMLTPCGSVHTFRMRFPIDVAYLDRRFTVLAVTTMKPGRLGLPRLRARHVVEAEAGAMERWGVRPGVRVELKAVSATAPDTA